VSRGWRAYRGDRPVGSVGPDLPWAVPIKGRRRGAGGHSREESNACCSTCPDGHVHHPGVLEGIQHASPQHRAVNARPVPRGAVPQSRRRRARLVPLMNRFFLPYLRPISHAGFGGGPAQRGDLLRCGSAIMTTAGTLIYFTCVPHSSSLLLPPRRVGTAACPPCYPHLSTLLPPPPAHATLCPPSHGTPIPLHLVPVALLRATPSPTTDSRTLPVPVTVGEPTDVMAVQDRDSRRDPFRLPGRRRRDGRRQKRDVADGKLPVESAAPVNMLPVNAAKVVETALATLAAAAVAVMPTAATQAVVFLMRKTVDANMPLFAYATAGSRPFDMAAMLMTEVATMAAAAVAAKPTAANQAEAFIMGDTDDANLPLVASATDDARPSDTAALVMTGVAMTSTAATCVKSGAAR